MGFWEWGCCFYFVMRLDEYKKKNWVEYKKKYGIFSKKVFLMEGKENFKEDYVV